MDKKINWYPGHMAAAKRMMEENLKLVDLIIEIRDARIPLASANPDIEKFNKPRLILLNKADLADEQKTKAWIDYFAKNGINAYSISAKKNLSFVQGYIDKVFAEKNEHFLSKGINRLPRALVAGIPNVGKSTVINSLSGAQRAKTGDKPGITRGKQWIKTKNVELLDSPGLLWPRLDDQQSALYLAFTGAINDDIFDLEELALMLLNVLREKYPALLEARYGITLNEQAIDDYEAICQKRGYFLKNKEFDYLRGAKAILDDFRSARIGNISLEEP